jgi:hypothetical protein
MTRSIWIAVCASALTACGPGAGPYDLTDGGQLGSAGAGAGDGTGGSVASGTGGSGTSGSSGASSGGTGGTAASTGGQASTGGSSGGGTAVDHGPIGPSRVAPCDPNEQATGTVLFASPGGSSGAAGTQSSPLDLGTAINRLSAGTTLYLLEGTYRPNSVFIDKSGTSTQPIRIKAHQCKKVVIDGQGKGEQGAFVSVWGRYVVIEDLEIANAEAFVALGAYCSNNTFRRNKVYNCRRSAITTYKYGDCTPDNVLFEGNVVHNCVLHNSARTATGGWNNAISSAHSNVVIRGNLVYQNYGEGIVVGGPGPVQVTGNVSYDNFATQIYACNSRNARIDGNLVYYTGSGMTMLAYESLPPNGIMAANENENGWEPPGENLTVVNNIVVGTRNGFAYESFQAGGGLKNSLIANNTLYGTLRATLRIDPDSHQGTRVMNNILQQLSGRPLVQVESSSGLTFASNLFHGGTGGAGVAASGSDVAQDAGLAAPGTFEVQGYELGSSSPALDRGTPLTEVGADALGTVRANPPDLGAIER